MPGLLDLPSALVGDIAAHLSRTDAVSLAQTCTELRHAAEGAVWTLIDMSPPNPDLRLSERQMAQIRTAQRLQQCAENSPIENAFVASVTARSLAAKLREAEAFMAFGRDLIKHFDLHPYLLQAVRAVRTDITRGLGREFAKLLELLAPRIKRLEFVGPEAGYLSAAPRTGTPEQIFRRLDTPFLALRHLEIPVRETWESRLRAVLAYTPNLVSLKITPSSPYDGGWGERFFFPNAVQGTPEKPIQPWPVLDLLETLEITQMADPLDPLVLSLVEGSKRLKRVVLRDPTLDWRPTPGDALLNALASLPKLEYLGIRWQCIWSMDHQAPGFGSLKMLSLDGAPGPLSFLHIKGLCLPWFPSLERLFLYPVAFASDPLWYWRYGGELPSRPLAIERIPKLTLNTLDNCPNLLLIMQLRHSEDEFLGDHWADLLLPPRDNEYELLLVRQYTSDSGNAAAESLTHIRAYSAKREYERANRIFHSSNVWIEHVSHNRFDVTADLLGKFYRARGEGTTWMTPGRGLPFVGEP